MTGSGASPEFITPAVDDRTFRGYGFRIRSEEHTSELQSRSDLVCRLLLEKKKKTSELQSLSDIVCSLMLVKKKICLVYEVEEVLLKSTLVYDACSPCGTRCDACLHKYYVM